MSEFGNWLITGVSSGLGLALADAALARGFTVAGTVRNDAAAQVFEARAPGRARAWRLDVTDERAVHDVVGRVEEALGGIDVVVNNAGYGLIGGVEEASLAEIRAQFDVNVFGAVAVMQAALPYLRKRRRGRIVNITSVSGFVGWPSLGIYSGSKFALEGISETLALELEPLGVKVIMIEPGGLRTDFATRSRQRTARQIEDYEDTVGACRKLLAEHAGHESGDPARAARAIVDAAISDVPPLRLLLGEDALGYARSKLDGQRDEIERWAAVTRSIAYHSGD